MGLRLHHLYDRLGVRTHDDDPTFPIRIKDLESLVNMRTRDVLDWCRDFQQRSIQRGGLNEPGSIEVRMQEDPKVVVLLEQSWNDFRTTFAEAVPEDDEPLLELLDWAVTRIGQELQPTHAFSTQREGMALVVAGEEGPLVVGIGNRDARGGGLHKQLVALRDLAKGRPVGIVRCSEFPENPRTKVSKDLGELLRDGGRRVTVQGGDWRTIMAFRAFTERNDDDPSIADWRRRERPLSQIASLCDLLMIGDGSKLSTDDEEAPLPDPVALVENDGDGHEEEPEISDVDTPVDRRVLHAPLRRRDRGQGRPRADEHRAARRGRDLRAGAGTSADALDST